ncbi:MAG: glycosyltransferase [Xanthomonadales bacterium]|nr:glycosyltransferase [Xanthomonadales bacterium]NIX13246.1 glycosyltransferase [Xanthomonadales bacterium]
MKLPTIVIPVFNAFEYVQECLASLDRHSPEAEVLVIDDDSTDGRVLPLLQEWAGLGNDRRLIRQTENRGFVHSANLGMAETDGDVVLLNSDTRATAGWLDALGRCLASDPGIATATPWTNNGEIASLPEFCQANPVPGSPDDVARTMRGCGAPQYPEIPTAVGFCMAVARRAVDCIGLFDAETFGRGYGEENDFCMRAIEAGFRNVLCDDAYVVHHGAASFGPIGLRADEGAMQRLLALHPAYLERVSAFIKADPLAQRREAILDALNRAGVGMR